MVRQTSLEAYETIKNNGLLSKRRWQVYDVLFRHGPLTAQGVYEIMVRESMAGTERNQFNVTSRLSDLTKRGVARETGKTKCPRSGMTVLMWDAPANLPVKYKGPKRIKCEHCEGRGYFEHDEKARLS